MEYTIRAIETLYRGHLFRSRLEATWAAFFDLCGWDWEYEPFELEGWLPDFVLLGKTRVLVEVKPVFDFPGEVAEKIVRASDHLKNIELLILGCGPVKTHDCDHCIGWLLDKQEDDGPYSLYGAWSWAGFRKFGNKFDFLHINYGWNGRIYGGYDGSTESDSPVDDIELIKNLWGQAKARTRYDHKGAAVHAH